VSLITVFFQKKIVVKSTSSIMQNQLFPPTIVVHVLLISPVVLFAKWKGSEILIANLYYKLHYRHTFIHHYDPRKFLIREVSVLSTEVLQYC